MRQANVTRGACIVLLAGFFASPVRAKNDLAAGHRDQDPRPTAQLESVLPLADVLGMSMADLDRKAILIEDVTRTELGLAPRYAVPEETFVTPDNDGTWEDIGEGRRLWRFRITSPDAISINLGFTRYRMPSDGRLLVYSADLGQVIRPFTAEDNAAHGELWTPPILSNDIVVEVTMSATSFSELELELTSINLGYRGFGAGAALRSGSCNVDVVCPEGDGWRDQISSVAVISTGGSTFCTGFMVNNTAEDLTPYFMTANHCGIGAGNAASLVVFWNYENSTCRPPGGGASGGAGDGTLNQFQTGSFFRAGYSPSDVTLVELDSDPDPAWNVGYSGWDRGNQDGTAGIAIHHPNTDEKRISFENDPLSTTTYLGNTSPGDGTHVRVLDWDLGTTEPGSSGSPLFDQNQRIVGQLHGGFAACGNNDADWYGRVSVSWTGGGSASSRLSDWLDPLGSGATTTDFISLNTLCSDEGTVELLSSEYACEDTLTARVIDCGLDLDPNGIDTVIITVDSTTEPAGESVLLTETTVSSAKFEGSLTLSETNAPGTLEVSAGDTITATYIDADDGLGGINVPVMAVASTDCTAPQILSVQTSNIQAREATVLYTTDEPTLGTVRFGFSCGALSQSATGTNFAASGSVLMENLQDLTTYFYAFDAEDAAGNITTDDNGGACYSFTTLDVPDFFTEEFITDNDLDNTKLTFSPNGSGDFYSACAESITALPTDPTGGTALALGDDASILVSPATIQTVSLYGSNYASFFVGSNGYITFISGDSDYTESLDEHFASPRISVLYDDLSPNQSGTVSWKLLADRIAVTWSGVTEYNAGNSNTLQVEMYFNGDITLSYLEVAATDGIAGLSGGGGTDPAFLENNLSNLGSCAAGTITAARSCLDHSGAGTFCFDLLANDLEVRSPGALSIEFDVSDPASSVSASVSCVNVSYAGVASVTAAGVLVTVDLSEALPDQDCCTISLTGDIEGSVTVRTLSGDIDRNGIVSTGDASIIKPNFGATLDATNFVHDYDANGVISTGDASTVKPNFGNTGPDCP